MITYDVYGQFRPKKEAPAPAKKETKPRTTGTRFSKSATSQRTKLSTERPKKVPRQKSTGNVNQMTI